MSIAPILPFWALALAGVLFVAVTVLAARGRQPGMRRRALLRGAAVLALLGACLRPGLPDGEAEAATLELNVFLVVDSSLSMAAEDHGDGIRLDGVRADIEAITERYAGARFSLITFDSVGRVRMPLTLDADAVRAGAEVIVPAPSMNSRGSSTTAGGPVLQERLKDAEKAHPERPAVVYYFGDGEDTSADAAASLGVDAGLVDAGAVLGYGTAQGGRMHDLGAEGEVVTDRQGDPAVSKLDEKRLRGLAEELGVPYVHRTDGASDDALFAATATGELEPGADPTAARTELTWILALLAFLLAASDTAHRIIAARRLGRPAGRRTT